MSKNKTPRPKPVARALSILFMAAILACSSNDNDLRQESPAIAIKRAADFCDSPKSEMKWVSDLIESSKDDPALAGPIYAFRSNGQAVFMHQPWIMSCLACILYDCDGNRLDSQTIDQEALTMGFQNLTKNYYPEMK